MFREEAETNLKVLESKMKNTASKPVDQPLAIGITGNLYETYYNAALSAYRAGNFPLAFTYSQKGLDIYPGHEEGMMLKSRIIDYYSRT